MQWQKYKSLDYLCQTSAGSNSCVVLFHGYGADAQDLASLSSVFDLSEPVDWFFPQGVFEVPIGPMMSGRAWFQLRVSDFERLSKNQIEDSALDNEVTSVLNRVAEWLNDLSKRYDQIYLGGFSQGAILVSHIFYRLRFRPNGLILYSGYLLHPSAFPIVPQEMRMPFYQSHGAQDGTLPIGGAQKLFDKLQELGLSGQWQQFNGGHEIPMTVIKASNSFLNSQLALGAKSSS